MNQVVREPSHQPSPRGRGDLFVSPATDEVYILTSAGNYVRLRDGLSISEAVFMSTLEPFYGKITLKTEIQ